MGASEGFPSRCTLGEGTATVWATPCAGHKAPWIWENGPIVGQIRGLWGVLAVIRRLMSMSMSTSSRLAKRHGRNFGQLPKSFNSFQGCCEYLVLYTRKTNAHKAWAPPRGYPRGACALRTRTRSSSPAPNNNCWVMTRCGMPRWRNGPPGNSDCVPPASWAEAGVLISLTG